MSAQVLAAQAGDPEAFAGLVRRWQGAVCAIGLAILRDVAASEDLAQEVFLAAWQGLSRLQDPASFGPWVRQLTRHKALDRRRAGMRYAARVVLDEEAVEQAGSTAESLLDAEERRVVQEALDALPDDARDVMVLFYREGHSVRQVALLLGLSEPAVKKRLSRARQAMREEVAARFAEVVQKSAPGAALTAAILASAAPAPAAAAMVGAAKTASAGGLWAGLAIGLTTITGLFLGYRLAERVVMPSRLPGLHRARNLSILSIGVAMAALPLGADATLVGVGLCVVGLGVVQFGLLPRVFAPPQEADPRRLRAARLGVTLGALGWLVGGICGLLGAWYGR